MMKPIYNPSIFRRAATVPAHLTAVEDDVIFELRQPKRIRLQEPLARHFEQRRRIVNDIQPSKHNTQDTAHRVQSGDKPSTCLMTAHEAIAPGEIHNLEGFGSNISDKTAVASTDTPRDITSTEARNLGHPTTSAPELTERPLQHPSPPKSLFLPQPEAISQQALPSQKAPTQPKLAAIIPPRNHRYTKQTKPQQHRMPLGCRDANRVSNSVAPTRWPMRIIKPGIRINHSCHQSQLYDSPWSELDHGKQKPSAPTPLTPPNSIPIALTPSSHCVYTQKPTGSEISSPTLKNPRNNHRPSTPHGSPITPNETQNSSTFISPLKKTVCRPVEIASLVQHELPPPVERSPTLLNTRGVLTPDQSPLRRFASILSDNSQSLRSDRLDAFSDISLGWIEDEGGSGSSLYTPFTPRLSRVESASPDINNMRKINRDHVLPTQMASVSTWNTGRLRKRARLPTIVDDEEFRMIEGPLIPSIEIDGNDANDVIDEAVPDNPAPLPVSHQRERDDGSVLGNEYIVSRIIGEKIGTSIHQFLVEWVNYPGRNWIHQQDCSCQEKINEFRDMQGEWLSVAHRDGLQADIDELHRLSDAGLEHKADTFKFPKCKKWQIYRRNARNGRFQAPGMGGVTTMVRLPTVGPRENTAFLPRDREQETVFQPAQPAGENEVIWLQTEVRREVRPHASNQALKRSTSPEVIDLTKDDLAQPLHLPGSEPLAVPPSVDEDDVRNLLCHAYLSDQDFERYRDPMLEEREIKRRKGDAAEEAARQEAANLVAEAQRREEEALRQRRQESVRKQTEERILLRQRMNEVHLKQCSHPQRVISVLSKSPEAPVVPVPIAHKLTSKPKIKASTKASVSATTKDARHNLQDQLAVAARTRKVPEPNLPRSEFRGSMGIKKVKALTGEGTGAVTRTSTKSSGH